MKTRKTITAGIATVLTAGLILTGCTQAERASRNVSVEADNFNVDRRLAVINTITGEPQLELIGKFSISDADNQLEVTVRDEEGSFKKHIVGLGPTVRTRTEKRPCGSPSRPVAPSSSTSPPSLAAPGGNAC